jgi:hypothetical protein
VIYFHYFKFIVYVKFFEAQLSTVKKFSCEFTAVIAGNCMLCCFNSKFTNKINTITKKTNKITKILVFLSVLYVFLLIFYYDNRAHSCQLWKQWFHIQILTVCQLLSVIFKLSLLLCRGKKSSPFLINFQFQLWSTYKYH